MPAAIPVVIVPPEQVPSSSPSSRWSPSPPLSPPSITAITVAGVAAGGVLAVLPYAHLTALRNVILYAGLIALALGWRHLSGQRRRDAMPMVSLLIAWASLGLLSLTWAVDRAYSASELQSEVLYAALVFALFFFLADRVWLKRWFQVVVATSLLSLLVVGWRFGVGDTGLAKFYNGPGLYSTYLCVVYPIALIGLLQPDQSWRVRAALIGVRVVVAVGGWLTVNRTLWIVMGLQTLLVIVLAPGRGGPGGVRTALAVRASIALAALALLAATLYAVSASRFSIAPNTPNASSAIAQTATSDIRGKIWPYALKRIAERPWTGAGIGRGALREDLRATFGSGLIWHAHNVVLNFGISLGVPGMILIVGIFIVVLAQFTRIWRNGPAWLRPYALAAIVIVVGLIAKSMTDDFFYRQTTLIFWALIGMIVGAASRERAGLVSRERAAFVPRERAVDTSQSAVTRAAVHG